MSDEPNDLDAMERLRFVVELNKAEIWGLKRLQDAEYVRAQKAEAERDAALARIAAAHVVLEHRAFLAEDANGTTVEVVRVDTIARALSDPNPEDES